MKGSSSHHTREAIQMFTFAFQSLVGNNAFTLTKASKAHYAKDLTV